MDEDKQYTQEEVDEHVAGLKSALEKERAERKQAKLDLADLRTSHDELVAKFAELEQRSVADAAGVDEEKLSEIRKKIRADVRREYAPQLEENEQLKQYLGERDATIRELKLDNVVKSVMANSGVRPNRIDALFKLTEDRYELSEDGEVIIKDKRATPLDKYIGTELSTEYPELYEGSGSSGGGASRSAGRAGSGTKYIAAGDKKAFLDNLEEIAKGEVEIRQ